MSKSKELMHQPESSRELRNCARPPRIVVKLSFLKESHSFRKYDRLLADNDLNTTHTGIHGYKTNVR